MCQFSTQSIERCRLQTILDAWRAVRGGAAATLLHDFGAGGWTMGRFGVNPIVAIRAANTKRGRCTCGAPRDVRPDGTRYATCRGCRERQRVRAAADYAAALERGQCARRGCLAAAADGRRMCEEHLEEARQRDRARREAHRTQAIEDVRLATLQDLGRRAHVHTRTAVD